MDVAAYKGNQDIAVSGIRRKVFTGAALLFALLLAVGLEAWTFLIRGWFVVGAEEIHRVHYLAWGALGGIIFVGGVLAQLRAPERKVAALQQVFLGILAVLIAMVLSGAIDAFVLGVLALGAWALAVLHPARLKLFAAEAEFSRPLLAMSVVGSVPLLTYALDMARIERITLVGDSHEGHWMMMAALSIAIVLVAMLASVTTSGIPARSAGAAAFVLGLASTLFPSYPGTVGRSWGIFAIVAASIFVTVSEWERKHRGPATGVSGG